MKNFSLLVLFFSSIGFASPQPVDVGSMIKFDVEKYKLPNGLTVLLHEDHSAPIISFQSWVRVGSKDEEKGKTGLAHLFEHLMFKATTKYPEGHFTKTVRENGMEYNAFTSFDYTGYYEETPKDKIEIVLDLESDRLVNLKITEEDLKKEREVVKEERRVRTDNNIFGKLREVMYSTVFKVHSYGEPIIGSMRDLNRLSVEECYEFYRKYYAPNNVVLVLAGDFESAKMKKLIEKYYGGLKASPTLSRKVLPEEPEQKGYRFQKVVKKVQSETFSISYKGPKSGADDAYALDVLSNIIGSGESSRLYRKIVYNQQLATSASAYNSTLQDAGMFSLYFSLKPGVEFEKARTSALGVVYKVRENMVTDKEIEKAKNQIMKSYVDALKTIGGKARIIAMTETLFKDYTVFFSDLEKYMKVTKEDVLAVAKKYLTVDKANVVTIRPQ